MSTISLMLWEEPAVDLGEQIDGIHNDASFRRIAFYFSLRNQFRKRDSQCSAKRADRIQTGIARTALNHADISLMKASLLCESLTTQFPGFPMSLQDYGKSIRKFHAATTHL